MVPTSNSIPDPDRPCVVLQQNGHYPDDIQKYDSHLPDEYLGNEAPRKEGHLPSGQSPHAPQLLNKPFDPEADVDGDRSSDSESSFKTNEDGTPSRRPSTRRKIKDIGHRAKRKSKHIIASAKARVGIAEPRPSDPPIAELDNNPAFEPAHLDGSKRRTVGGTADKILSTAHTAGKAILDPQSAAKRKAASTIAIQDRPYLSQDADLEYLEAHDDVSRLQSTETDSSDEDDRLFELREREDKVEKLERVRDGRRVAWTTSKHLKRVMVVPKRNLVPPRREEFYVVEQTTGHTKLDWSAYILEWTEYEVKSFALNNMGEVDPVGQQPFSRDIILRIAERLLIASSPWQSFFLNMRTLYRWEKPKETAKWAVIWFVIWRLNYVMTFVLCYTAFIVLQNRFSNKHVEQLRESVKRGSRDESKDARTLRFNELIDRHGSANWVDPLMEEAGPMVQMQLSDLTDFLEILSNFHAWRCPEKTWATLFWFACAIALGALTPIDYTMKIVFMFCYLSFFVGRPVASRYPQYRHIVNAAKWIFWDIPTDASWSMMYLQSRAEETRSRLIQEHVEEKYKHESKDTGRSRASSRNSQRQSATIPKPRIGTTDGANDLSDIDSFHTADSMDSAHEDIDLVSFKCRYRDVQGHLIIYSDGLRFVRASPLSTSRKEIWRHSWQDMVELRKVNYSAAAKIIELEGLEVLFKDKEANRRREKRRRKVPSASVKALKTFTHDLGMHRNDQHDHPTFMHHHKKDDGEHEDDTDSESEDDKSSELYGKQSLSDALIASSKSFRLEGLQGRDRAFNLILGFSGLHFQVLQPLTSSEIKEEKKATHGETRNKMDRAGDKVKEFLSIGKGKGSDDGKTHGSNDKEVK